VTSVGQDGRHRRVDPYVDRSQRVLDLLCRPFERLRVADVRGRDTGPPAGGADLRGRRLEAVQAAGDQPDVGTVSCQFAHRRPADARGRAGDDDHLSLEHGVTLPSNIAAHAGLGRASP
jgi:hypothetical protein